MCGITGITDPRMGKLEESIQEMTRAIAHRGPDDDGFFVDVYVALGMRRLAIIDLETGRQPISSPDERYIIFFNGEIYNYRELKRELSDYPFKTESDTEVILAGFIKWGAAGVMRRLRGMFALAIYDTEARKLVLARDMFGIKPLYYWKDAPHLPGTSGIIKAFSSEIKSFLQLPGFRAEVNDAAVYNYLSYQYNPLEETFFKDVYKLPPGHFLELNLKTGQSEIERYYHFHPQADESLEELQTKEKILNVIEDSVSHHMIADVPVGSFLSGGIDSSIIATLMQKIRGDKKIKTFTVGFTTLSEGKEAKETSEPLGTDHTEINVSAEEYFHALPQAVWYFDEPVADPSALGLFFLAQEARKSVKVVLSGEGADELFGGYNIYLEPFARRNIAWIPRPILKLIKVLPFRGRNYAERALSQLEDWYIGNASVFKKEEVKRLWKGVPQSEFSLSDLYEDVRHVSDSTKMQYIDIHTWLIGDILAKADKMTMAHSLELRVPFLDKEVAELARVLPDRFKWYGGHTKYLLREAFHSILPESTRKRKKLGFPTPVKDWFTKERKDVYEFILDNSYIRSHLNTEEIKKLVGEHLSGRKDNSRKIYLLLQLALWYNTFIER